MSKELDKYFNFSVRIAHIITCDSLNDIEKLNCVKLRYRELAFPERKFSEQEQKLIDRIE